MYELEVLDRSQLGDFAALMTPVGRTQIEQMTPDPPLVGVLAQGRDQPLGLAVSWVHPQSGAAGILSLYVTPASRTQGIGTTLLRKTEAEAIHSGCAKMSGSFKHSEPDMLPLKRVLVKCGWDPPQVQGYEYHTTVERFLTELSWARRPRPLPYQGYIFPWTELTPQEKQTLQDEEGPDSWRAVGTSPFLFEGKFDPQTSLGLRVRGEVVGWMINHQVKSDTILYESYFVRPKFRGLGLSIGLLRESVKRQRQAGIPHMTWYVEAANTAARKLYHKLVGPCVSLEEEWWLAMKTLSQGEGNEEILNDEWGS